MCCCGDCLKNTVADQSAALHALGFPMQFYPASWFASSFSLSFTFWCHAQSFAGWFNICLIERSWNNPSGKHWCRLFFFLLGKMNISKEKRHCHHIPLHRELCFVFHFFLFAKQHVAHIKNSETFIHVLWYYCWPCFFYKNNFKKNELMAVWLTNLALLLLWPPDHFTKSTLRSSSVLPCTLLWNPLTLLTSIHPPPPPSPTPFPPATLSIFSHI